MTLIPIARFFTTGTSANIPLGAGVKGFVDEDVPLAFAATAAARLQVAPTAEPLPVVEPVASTPGVTASAGTATAVQ